MHLAAPLEKNVDDFYALTLVEEKLSLYINDFKDQTVLEDAVTYHFSSGEQELD
jgi:hypothetical protein